MNRLINLVNSGLLISNQCSIPLIKPKLTCFVSQRIIVSLSLKFGKRMIYHIDKS